MTFELMGVEGKANRSERALRANSGPLIIGSTLSASDTEILDLMSRVKVCELLSDKMGMVESFFFFLRISCKVLSTLRCPPLATLAIFHCRAAFLPNTKA